MGIEIVKKDQLEASQSLHFHVNNSERLTIYNNGNASFTGTITTHNGSHYVKEKANAEGDSAGFGQIWVKNASPNELYFTNDAGNDIQLTSGSSAAGGGGTDSFLIFGEESDEYLNEGGAGNAHGFFAAYGNGVHNTTKLSTGAYFGLPLGCDCTLKAVRVHCGNKNSSTSSTTITFDIYKNNSAESDTFTGNASGSSGNAFIISKTNYDIDFSAGDTFNIKVTTPASNNYTAKVGPTRMTAYFERQ